MTYCTKLEINGYTLAILYIIYIAIYGLVTLRNTIVTEFWEIDPNHTFIFDYTSHYHMNSIINFVWTSKLKLSKTSKKYSPYYIKYL